MKNLTKAILIFITVILFIVINSMASASYEKPTAPSELSSEIIISVNLLLDKVYDKKNNLTKYPTEQKYIDYLDRVNIGLNNLKLSFNSSDSKYILISYFTSGITNIKNSVKNNSNILDNISNIINDNPDNTTSSNTTSSNTTSSNNTSSNTTSGNNTSSNTTSGNNTSSNTTSGNNTSSTNNTSSLNCKRNGITYISGDVRCDGNNQVRCDGGSFKHIYTCATTDVCYEKPERTSNGNFYTSCESKSQIFYTNGGNGSGNIPETELSTLKENAQYKCSFNSSTAKYGNCVFQSCSSSAHDEGGNCIYNTRKCDIENTTNGGKQTWSLAGGWGACQFTTSTKCNSGYKDVGGKCVTGAATCNQTSIITKEGVEYSNKTAGIYEGVWLYDTTLSKACTYKCKEGYKKTIEVAGYRGSEVCIKKNICDSDEYFNSNWLSTQNAAQACHGCNGTMPYGGSSSDNLYTSSTLRPSYTNNKERTSGENTTWKYINTSGLTGNQIAIKLTESCTRTCKNGLVPGRIKNPMTAIGPLTCCDPNSSTCIQN